jgi:hypothetical protein
MSRLLKAPWTLLGLTLGLVVVAVELVWFEIDPNGVPFTTIEYTAYPGFVVLNQMHQGFPVNVSKFWTNTVLLASGAIQWGLVGLMLDLVIKAFKRR